jgi:hypothetical protein
MEPMVFYLNQIWYTIVAVIYNYIYTWLEFMQQNYNFIKKNCLHIKIKIKIILCVRMCLYFFPPNLWSKWFCDHVKEDLTKFGKG